MVNRELPTNQRIYKHIKHALINMSQKSRCNFKLKQIIYTYIVTQLIKKEDR